MESPYHKKKKKKKKMESQKGVAMRDRDDLL